MIGTFHIEYAHFALVLVKGSSIIISIFTTVQRTQFSETPSPSLKRTSKNVHVEPVEALSELHWQLYKGKRSNKVASVLMTDKLTVLFCVTKLSIAAA